MFKLIIYIFIALGSEMFFYKYIRKIDKKERAKLQIWEDEYIDNEIEKIKKNNLNYKTNKRKKGSKNDTDTTVHTDTDSTNNS